MKILKNILMGLMSGFTMMTISLLFIVLFESELGEILTKTSILKSILSSALIGVTFYLGSLIYENDKLAMGLKTLIHMGSGLIVFYLGAIFAEWIPLYGGIGALIGFVLFTLAISFSIWFGYYLYYKKEAKKINAQIHNRQ
ncbi:MAG: DUF3021 domain-containing protein [Acholeplasmatales bacterium]|jgi:hypothetical protein|nr:DUF3021 domain-containing protein [Acholeplasmataceae bacterium]MDY0115348.1 DUF3021 domain-containing protein [Acholeplasmatales bacterium]MCK9234045.1 DUF3021 domain-containing protein [Acholeplasmataceae bacterium]MCK9289770.1 DUF3021 domain-containing protein [Acholeplasmataceae bacterium]MCK9428059.1 DUF3021 domain-containing protein [Acholeplasmataceae bacterium]